MRNADLVVLEDSQFDLFVFVLHNLWLYDENRYKSTRVSTPSHITQLGAGAF